MTESSVASAATVQTVFSGPTTTSGPAFRYAQAFFDLADEEKALESAETDFGILRKSISSSTDFRDLLKSPVYTAEEKGAAVSAIAEKANISALTKNFLAVLAANRRLFVLDAVIEAFFSLLSERRGEISAEAISAAPLNDDQTKRLRGEIERYVGKAVNLNTKVDPELLGGLVVKIGSTMVDSSLRSKLNRLKS
ncbi:MAG: F0F1 ATP synthase subunit delta, partial [Pseudomonadota bacterium]